MNTRVAVRSLLAGLVLTVAAPLHAQRVEAGVVVHGGPVAGHVIVRDRDYRSGYSTYRRPVTRRVIVVERPRVVVVERVHRHRPARHWERRGYRPVIVYYWDGRYYDHRIGHRRDVHEVMVWERDGRYYHDGCDSERDWND